MAWVQQGSIRGPQGPIGNTGLTGKGVSSAVVNGAGELVFTFTDTTTANVGVVKGLNGADGQSFKFQGEVNTFADLPVLANTAADKGKAYLVVGGAEPQKGNLFVWGGTAYTDAGQIAGPQGIQGIQGAPGPAGAKGDTGDQGAQGLQGPAGIQGVKGDTGLKGDTGTKGDTGNQGIQGVQGVKGDQGTTGTAGADGAVGPQGPQGLKGDQGTAGIKGDTGTTGVRGSQWYTGNGAPGAIAGQLPGDKYLDVVSGTVYNLT